MTIDKTKHLEMFLKMMQTRRFEETAAKLFTMGKVHGTAHFCIGEEATGIGATCALEIGPDSWSRWRPTWQACWASSLRW